MGTERMRNFGAPPTAPAAVTAAGDRLAARRRTLARDWCSSVPAERADWLRHRTERADWLWPQRERPLTGQGHQSGG